jgi:hypothetical protein
MNELAPLTQLAELIDRLGIPIVLAWFMLRVEKILGEMTK